MYGALGGGNSNTQTKTTDELQAHMLAVLAAIEKEAKAKNYPIFRSTSCAISWTLGRECYGARFRPINEGKSCLSCAGTEEQQQRCITFRRKNMEPSQDLLTLVKRKLDVDDRKIYFDQTREVIRVEARIRQDAQAHLTQVTSFPILANDVEQTLAWRGDAPSTKTRH